jgi:hypothetical protein
VKDLIESRPNREFSFDHALWSFDGFAIDPVTGYTYPVTPKYCD